MTKIYSSLSEIKSELQNGKVTVEGLVKHYLGQIEKNAHLNAFNEVFGGEALQNAKDLDNRLKQGRPVNWLVWS